MKTTAAAALAAFLAFAVPALADGDPVKGKAVFNKCKACHVADSDTNKVGPSLKGLIGRNTASVPGYKYSEAMLEYAKTNPVWDDAHFLKYIENPKASVPKTKMAFAGLKKEDERVDLLAYLKTMK